jgi:hypothetical protein
MTAKKRAKRLLTGADLRDSGKKLIEVEVIDSDGTALGVVFMRQLLAKDVLDYDEKTDNRQATVQMILKSIVTEDSAPLFADADEVESLPLPIFGALSNAITERLNIKKEDGGQEGNVSGEAAAVASPTA